MKCYLCSEKISKYETPDNHHPDKTNKPDWTESVHHKCHMIHHGIYPKNYNALRQLVEAKKDYQQTRVRFQLQMVALKRLGYKPSKNQEGMFELMLKEEHKIIEEYRKIVRCLSLWKEWGKDVHGLGEDLFGQIIAYIGDVSRFPTVGNLYACFGYAVREGKIQSRKKGHDYKYSGKLQPIMYVLFEKGFIMHKKKSYYGKQYDRVKKEYRKEHPKSIDTGKKCKNGKPMINYTDGHIHNMAIRKIAKEFLKDLWIEWRTLDGLPLTQSYMEKQKMN